MPPPAERVAPERQFTTILAHAAPATARLAPSTTSSPDAGHPGVSAAATDLIVRGPTRQQPPIIRAPAARPRRT
ncbi:hypothetical protein ACWD00_33005 [Streptomyces viridiviolaceus]